MSRRTQAESSNACRILHARRAARSVLAASATVAMLSGHVQVFAGEAIEREFAAMGTRLHMKIVSRDRKSAMAASERAFAAVNGVDVRLSTWRADTDLARLNAAKSGEWVAVSPKLVADLEAAAKCHADTEGFFDPAIAPLVQAWDLRGKGRIPDDAELAEAVRVSGMDKFEFSGGRARKRVEGAGIEEGGFGKGVALDAALAELLSEGVESARLDFGGQIAVLTQDKLGFPLGVADPVDRTRTLLEIALPNGSASTSGNGERAVSVNGARIGHLLNPKTGRPAPDFGSVTVLAETAAAADCLSTGLFAMGPDRALQWARKRPPLQVIVVETMGAERRVRASGGLKDGAKTDGGSSPASDANPATGVGN